MKICPTCRRTYEDASLVFCLDDGAKLREPNEDAADATLHLAQPPAPTVRSPGPNPRPTVPAQATITARPDHYQAARPYQVANVEEPRRRSPLPWIFAIVVVLAVSGVLIAWLLTQNRGGNLGGDSSPTPQPSASTRPSVEPSVQPTPTPAVNDETPRPTPLPTEKPEATKEKPKSMFAVLNNMTLNGSRITYYPRPSFEQCQADCAANANCKAFTWIRPGAYNAGDSAMCYLMSAVTGKVPHACCITGIRN